MSKKTAIGIHARTEAFAIVGVAPQEEGRWAIEILESGRMEEGPSGELRAQLGIKGRPLTLMPEGKEVRHALTSLPRLKKKELNLAVGGWVAREEGTSVEEWRVAWDERRRPDPDPERTDAFILYAPREKMDACADRLQQWGGAPTRLLPDYLIVEQMFRLHGPDHTDLEGWNLVFVTQQEQFLCVSTHAGMILTRELPADLTGGVDEAEHIERLATEVDRSMFFARQTEYNPRIDKVIVCGDPALATALVAKLEEETNVAVGFWDLADHFVTTNGALEGAFLLAAMAAALAPEKSSLNLLPGTGRTLLTPLVRRRLALAASTAALTLVPLLTVGGLLTGRIQDRYLRAAGDRLDGALERAEEAKAVYRAEKLLEDRRQHVLAAGENRQDFAGVLQHLAALTPAEVVFKDLRLREGPDGRPHIFLTGQSTSSLAAEAQQAFLTFQEALDGSEWLEGAGEPRKLVITVDDESGTQDKKVEFSLEYGIRANSKTAQDGPDEVALREGR